MALHDYQCPTCGFILRDHNVPCAIGAQAGAPYCPQHCVSTERNRPDDPIQRMEWIPAIGRMDAYEPFQEFQTTDCYGRPVLVESMTQLRKIEEESQREYRDGPQDDLGHPKAQLLNWRDYSNDRSNRDVNTIAKHMDRPMDMQEDRIEADPSMGRRPIQESHADALAGTDVATSAGDQLGGI